MKISDILDLGLKYGYVLRRVDEQAKVIIFDRSDVQINVFYTTMTVATILDHPVRGSRSQLFRRNVSSELLEKIMDNPRAHTGNGYRRAPQESLTFNGKQENPMVNGKVQEMDSKGEHDHEGQGHDRFIQSVLRRNRNSGMHPKGA